MNIPANAKYAIIRETSLRTDNLLSIKQLLSHVRRVSSQCPTA